MDKSIAYQELIKKTLTDYHLLTREPSLKHPDDDVVEHLIVDDDHQRYMLFRVGWWESKRVRSAGVYIHLEHGKIWIEEDWTEDGIASYLLAAGVPREDIVLAFHPPELREEFENVSVPAS